MDAKATLAARLKAGGFIAPAEEAEALLAAADGDAVRLKALVSRRLSGEPLAWITGRASFCGAEIRVDPGVYVPRWHTEELALRAALRCPPTGIVADLCTGCGAVAATIGRLRPGAQVLAADVDERAVKCAKANGVEAYQGDLFAAVPGELRGRIDVLVAVAPYVPSGELQYLQRDALTFEGPMSYAGRADGADLLRRIIADGSERMCGGGSLLLELGGLQTELLRDDLARYGYTAVAVLRDEDGDVRGIEATYRRPRAVGDAGLEPADGGQDRPCCPVFTGFSTAEITYGPPVNGSENTRSSSSWPREALNSRSSSPAIASAIGTLRSERRDATYGLGPIIRRGMIGPPAHAVSSRS